jgi:hypothetical protein
MNSIENKKIWIEVTSDAQEKIYVISDKQNCVICDNIEWIVGFVHNSNEIYDGICFNCIRQDSPNLSECIDVFTSTSLSRSIQRLARPTLCESRYCIFCNKRAKFKYSGSSLDPEYKFQYEGLLIQICENCVTTVIENTQELYKICKVPSICQPACKFCKSLRPSKSNC